MKNTESGKEEIRKALEQRGYLAAIFFLPSFFPDSFLSQ